MLAQVARKQERWRALVGVGLACVEGPVEGVLCVRNSSPESRVAGRHRESKPSDRTKPNDGKEGAKRMGMRGKGARVFFRNLFYARRTLRLFAFLPPHLTSSLLKFTPITTFGTAGSLS